MARGGGARNRGVAGARKNPVNDLNRLTCDEVFRRLDDYLDRELTAEEMKRVKEHLDTCEACAREHRFADTILSRLREKVRRISVPKDLAEKISRSLEKTKKDRAG